MSATEPPLVHLSDWAQQPEVHLFCDPGPSGATPAFRQPGQPEQPELPEEVYLRADGQRYAFEADLATCPACLRAALREATRAAEAAPRETPTPHLAFQGGRMLPTSCAVEGCAACIAAVEAEHRRAMGQGTPPRPQKAPDMAALPWTKGQPTVERVAAHEAAHPSLAVGGWGFRGAKWLVLHDPDGDRLGAYPGLVTLRVAHPGEARHAVWIDQGRGVVTEPTIVTANGFSFRQPLAPCSWAPGALWQPCTAEGVPLCLVAQPRIPEEWIG